MNFEITMMMTMMMIMMIMMTMMMIYHHVSKSKTNISVVIPTGGYGVHELQDNVNNTVEEKWQWGSPLQCLWTLPKTT